MDSSRVVLALQEQEKWRDRRKRVEEKIRQVRARKMYFRKELETTRGKIAQFGALVASIKDRAGRAGARAQGPESLR